VPHPSKILKKGDVIQARVLDVDAAKQKISLGIKQLQPNPWELLADKYPVGSRIKGLVRNLTDFGAFVEIEEGIDGLIHVSDLSWAKRVMNPADVLGEGDEVEAVVLSIDAEKQRVSLGLKQIEPDPWIQVPEKYAIGSVVRGRIVNITSFGAFAKLEEGVEGLIHISELDERHVDNPEEIVSVGEEVDLKVISLDPEERRIGLSLKEAKADQEQSVINRYMDGQYSDRTTLADLMDRSNVSIGFESRPSQPEQTEVLPENLETSISDAEDASDKPQRDGEDLIQPEQAGPPSENTESAIPDEDEVSDEPQEDDEDVSQPEQADATSEDSESNAPDEEETPYGSKGGDEEPQISKQLSS
jgi:ribosomal protein S1